MKNRALLLQLIVIISLLVVLSFVSKSCLDGRKEKARLESNLANYSDKYKALELTKSELQNELKKDVPQYKTVDSLVKSDHAKPKQIKSLYVTKVKISNTDTVPVANKDTATLRDSLRVKQYKTPFTDSRNCIAIAGYVVSTDQSPQVYITSQNATIETYDITLKRRWWQFWKPKTWVKTFTRCGDLEVIKINVK